MLVHALKQMQAKKLGVGKYFDGQGLMLCKSNNATGKWVLRLVVDRRRREMGLGVWPDVSIAEARERAAIARRQLRNGIDPIEARAKDRYRPRPLTVEQAIDGCFKAKQAELKNDGKSGRWLSPLKVHVIPKIGQRCIEDVDQHVLKTVLDPIWQQKPETAHKCLGRLSLTLKHAAALGLDVDLQAAMKVKALLGKQRREVKHIPALPYNKAPAFYQRLCQLDYSAAYALRFLMLTATRTSEVRFATHDEIDGDIWTIPADRTKTGKEHRVPLTDEAKRVINLARSPPQQKLMFLSPTGKALSDAAMARVLDREGQKARPHGMRATFRTWAENETNADWETKEMVLGHVVGSEVERAYQRSDTLQKRSALLSLWSSYLAARPEATLI